MIIDTNKERSKAVREAWKNEKAQVLNGKGTRDWSQAEQRQIVAKGRANGIDGHHMKSVSKYPKHAGNPDNIQFLNRKEHVGGAHKGNTTKPTNGYYNPKTGTTHSFGNRNPQAPQSQSLSTPLTQRQQNLAIKREQARKQAARLAKAESKQPVQRNIQNAKSNKGIQAARQRASANQLGKSPNQSTNQGIKSFQARASGQSASTSKSAASAAVKGIATGGKLSGIRR